MTRSFNLGKKLLDARSLGASFQSDPMKVGGRQSIASVVLEVTTSDAEGSFLIKARNGNGSFNDIGISPAAVVDGASAVLQISLVPFPFDEFVVAYERTAGTGTVTAYVSTKGVG